MEWSLVQGDPTGISVFFVDAGSIPARESFCPKQWTFRTVRRSLKRSSIFSIATRAFIGAPSKCFSKKKSRFKLTMDPGRRYYVMSKLFQDVAQRRISKTVPSSEFRVSS